MKKKVHKIQILRHVLQIAAFFLVPGLFADTFHALQSIFVQILHGSVSWDTMARPLWILFGTVPVTVFFGRYFCGFLCSFGAMGDFLWFLSGRFFRNQKKHKNLSDKAVKSSKSAAEKNRKMDQILKYLKYVVLLLCVSLVWTRVITIESYSPWTAFGQWIAPGNWKNLKGILGWSSLILLLIIAASLFVERFFCRYLCPMGAIYAILSKMHPVKIVRKDDLCGKCQVCTSHCSMGIDLRGKEQFASAECIKCMKCVEGCPRQNLQLKGNVPVYAAVIVLVVTVGISQYALRHLPAASTELSAEEMESLGTGGYEDGVYTGSARGYRGETSVTVTVEDGNITGIEVNASDDDEKYMEMAKGVIPEILSEQSMDVDAVSGATLSSYGILYAARAALPAADAADLVPEEKGKFEDGVYPGTGQAYRGEVEVEVTVENGNIADIRVISYYDDEQYLDYAIDGVIPRIIAAQDLNVDAVSGATYSSNGILRATANALGIPEEELHLVEGEGLDGKNKHHGHRVKKYK